MKKKKDQIKGLLSLAIIEAWEAWKKSETGGRALNVASLTPGPYLENRLRGAFRSGWSRARKFK